MRVRQFLTILVSLAVLVGAFAIVTTKAQAAPNTWMPGGYGSRYQMNIQIYDNAIGTNNTLTLTFDHAAMVAGGKSLASGDDVRIGFYNYLDGSWTDVNRVLGPGAAWNQKSTTLMFRPQAYLDSNRLNGDYFLYYDKPTATAPPADITQVVRKYDGFGGTGAVDSSKWATVTRTGVAVEQTGGQLKVSGAVPADCAGCTAITFGIEDTDTYFTNIVIEADVTLAAGTSTAVRNANRIQYGLNENQINSAVAGGAKQIGYTNSGTQMPLNTSTVTSADTTTHHLKLEYDLDTATIFYYEDGYLVAQRPNMTDSYIQPLWGIAPLSYTNAFDLRYDNIYVYEVAPTQPTVQLSDAPVSVWDANYAHKQQIVVNNGASSQTMPEGYSIPVTIDHASLVTAGRSLASGNDVRVVYWNGSSYRELDRIIDPKSAWNTTGTKLWFRTQSPIQGNAVRTEYYLMYGYTGAAAPPANGARVFDFYDNFSSNTIDPAKYTFGSSLNGRSASAAAGAYRQTGTPTGTNDTSMGLILNQSFNNDYSGEATVTGNVTAGIAAAYTLHVGGAYDRLYVNRTYNSTNSVGYCASPCSSSANFTGVGSTTMTGTTWNTRVTLKNNVSGQSSWAENGVTRGTRSNGPLAGAGLSQPAFLFAPNVNQAVDVSFDDIWIRRLVETEPTAFARTNAAPNAPTNLSMSVNGSAVAAGGGVNSDNVTFEADATDPDGPEGFQLCVEFKPAGVAFANTDTSCSSGTLSPQGVGRIYNNFSELGDGTAWRWQARVRDVAGLSSPWVDFNANGTAADVFIDRTAPDAPSSLQQSRIDNAAVVPVGQWMNYRDINFAATVTDSATTVRLCLELKQTSQAFDGAVANCSPYVSTGNTATVAMTNMNYDRSYHWRVRTQDLAGNNSAWVSFGGNSDAVTADRDIGFDGNNPTVGTVFDGGSAGIQSNVSTSSLTALTANWSGFADPVGGGGLSYYTYSIGTSVGATDVRGWTANGLATTVTASGLNLKTGQKYVFNVRAYDVAGNNSSTASSSGQTVAPMLTANLNQTALTFDLTTANGFAATNSVTATTSTNAANGYGVYLTAAAPTSGGGASISNTFTGTYANPAAWSGYGIGYTSNDSSVGGSNRFAGSSQFAALTVNPQLAADTLGPISGTGGPVTNETFTFGIRSAASPLQAAGRYSTILQVSFIANF